MQISSYDVEKSSDLVDSPDFPLRINFNFIRVKNPGPAGGKVVFFTSGFSEPLNFTHSIPLFNGIYNATNKQCLHVYQLSILQICALQILVKMVELVHSKRMVVTYVFVALTNMARIVKMVRYSLIFV